MPVHRHQGEGDFYEASQRKVSNVCRHTDGEGMITNRSIDGLHRVGMQVGFKERVAVGFSELIECLIVLLESVKEFDIEERLGGNPIYKSGNAIRSSD